MGVYTQSNVEIACLDKASASKVKNLINQKCKENLDDLNYDCTNLELSEGETIVCLNKASNRTQNLDYQLEELWKLIKDIDGVVEMNAPVMVEGDGHFYTNEKSLDS